MTTKREQAMRNAVASARMEGLPVSKQTERDCVRYLEGRIDTATLVQEILTISAVFRGNVLQRSFWTSMNGPMSCIRSGKGMGGRSVCFWPSWRRMQAIGWIFPVWMPMS